MKVVVATNTVPFLRGGAEHLADALVANLRLRGHQAELLRLPLRWGTATEVMTSMAAAAATRVPGADVVLPLKFPAWYVQHDVMVPWVLHQLRQVYDMWGSGGLPGDPGWRELRRMVRGADTDALGSAPALFCNGSVTAERMFRYNGLTPAVLLPPHGAASTFRTDGYEDFLLAPGRVTASKRQHLLVEALAQCPGSWRLVVAGHPETAGDLQRLHDLLRRHGVEDRVELLPEFISDELKVDLLARARAVAYLPVDEDSYGYVTLEAMLSRKPVLTCSDSGGILQLVADGVTGAVTAPDPSSLAAGMTRLMEDQAAAQRLGTAGRAAAEALDLSWDATISRLLS